MGRTLTVPSVEKLQTVWSKLSTNDRLRLLGHADDALSAADAMKLMRIIARLSKNTLQKSDITL